MKDNEGPSQSVASLVPFSEFLASIGRSVVSGWRLRKNGVLHTVNIYGKLYITREEIEKWEKRARAGEFARKVKPPARANE